MSDEAGVPGDASALPEVDDVLAEALQAQGEPGVRALGLLRDARRVMAGAGMDRPWEIAVACLRSVVDALLSLPGAPVTVGLKPAAEGLLAAVDAVPELPAATAARPSSDTDSASPAPDVPTAATGPAEELLVAWERGAAAAEALRTELVKPGRYHQGRARAVIERLTGVTLGAAQETALNVWGAVYGATSGTLHSKPAVPGRAVGLYGEVLAAAHQLLVPLPDHAARILELAAVQGPGAVKAAELAGWADPRATSYFLRSGPAPAWLGVLQEHAPHLLTADGAAGGRWPAVPFLEHVADADPDAARAWLAAPADEKDPAVSRAQQVAASGRAALDSLADAPGPAEGEGPALLGSDPAPRALGCLLEYAVHRARTQGEMPADVLQTVSGVLAAHADQDAVATAIGVRLPALHRYAPAFAATHQAALYGLTPDCPSPAASWLRWGPYDHQVLAALDRTELLAALRHPSTASGAAAHTAAALLTDPAFLGDPAAFWAELATGTGGAEAVGLLLAAIAARTPRTDGPLPPDATARLTAAADLWRTALAAGLPPGALAGAGDFAATGLDDDLWLSLMRVSAEHTPTLTDADLVAERAARHPNSEEALLLAAQLVTHPPGRSRTGHGTPAACSRPPGRRRSPARRRTPCRAAGVERGTGQPGRHRRCPEVSRPTSGSLTRRRGTALAARYGPRPSSLAADEVDQPYRRLEAPQLPAVPNPVRVCAVVHDRKQVDRWIEAGPVTIEDADDDEIGGGFSAPHCRSPAVPALVPTEERRAGIDRSRDALLDRLSNSIFGRTGRFLSRIGL
ncbi:hypothetical protein [Streptomyces chartreusis]|uniref:hypothetical protein n=1 Tax=Streptomyces chartreusis TaxID=1969 RepID=UPI0035D9D9AC